MAPPHSRAPDCTACQAHEACFVPHAAPGTRALLHERLEQRRLARGHYVSREGEVSTAVKVLREGSLLASRTGIDGQARPISFLVRGALVGLSGLLRQPNQTSTQVLEAATTCEVPIALLRAVAESDEAMRQRLRAASVAATGHMSDWSQVARAPGLVQQVGASLLLMAREQASEAVQVPGISAWAELLGAGRDGVARALSVLQAEGLVTVLARQRCRIDARRLEERLAQG